MLVTSVLCIGVKIRVVIKGSHRQFKHPHRPGRVTVAGRPSDDLAPGTLKSIARQSGMSPAMSQAFAVVIEETDHNFSAYVPDLPGKSSFMPA